jgi:hypothetical protein
MSERDAAVQAVLRVIHGYVNPATGRADPVTGEQVLQALEELGWARPEMVRVLVASAGGRVIIPDRIMEDPPRELSTWRDERMSSTVVAAS